MTEDSSQGQAWRFQRCECKAIHDYLYTLCLSQCDEIFIEGYERIRQLGPENALMCFCSHHHVEAGGIVTTMANKEAEAHE
jgi:hypothetical protein